VGFAARFKTIVGKNIITEAARAEDTVVDRRIPACFGLDSIHDVQVLCPMNRAAITAHSAAQAHDGLLGTRLKKVDD
jgi:hypothetical protein